MGSHPKLNDGSKQVRVDNWGVFFLQRLQAFFNKTDYCDLTLQFEGNVQLKVHRLVINACTEYFHILEQTCEMIDDVLMMPADLQADVVLPIVNFMYTGMLEFHTSVFDKLYKTANLMNITVLTKLLDAQRGHNQPRMLNKRLQSLNSSSKKSVKDPDLPAPLPGRKLPVWKRKSVPSPAVVVPHYYQEQKRFVPDSLDNKPKPTRFEWPEDDLSGFNAFDNNFDDISYTSKPLVTEEDEPRPSTSFDRIRDSADTNQQQKLAANDYEDLDIDMDDVRDYVKEQKIRSNIIMNEDEDHDVDNDYESEEEDVRESQKRKSKFDSPGVKRVRFSTNEKENQVKQAKINITPTGKVNSDVDHTRIISEVLKKYPNLVRKNKNIRLKILAKNNAPQTPTEEPKKPEPKKPRSSYSSKTVKAPFIEEKGEDDGPWKCLLCSTPDESIEFVLYYLFRKHMTDVHSEKFDTRMCKYCGHKSSMLNTLAYHQYTRHCIKPPPSYTFPKCSKCPFIALNDTVLTRHKANHSKLESQCQECKITFTNMHTLTAHMQITGHSSKSGKINFDCQYCIKKFPYGTNLFAHIRLQHIEDARKDGIVSLDEFDDELEDEEEEEEEQVEYITPNTHPDKNDKIKIIQDLKLPAIEQGSESLNQQSLALEPSSEAEALSNVASGIATSLGLVDVVVLDDNQQYILHTDNQPIASGGTEYIIPNLQETPSFSPNHQEQNVLTQSMLHGANIASTDELVMVLTDHDYGDGNNELINNENSKIVVLYSHPIDGSENQFITSQGNLMLTSQAGLIELRNGSTVVTSTSSHFITTNTDSHENTHIESIEMIQREINQQPSEKNQEDGDLNQQADSDVSQNVCHASEKNLVPKLEKESLNLDTENPNQSNNENETLQLSTTDNVENTDIIHHEAESFNSIDSAHYLIKEEMHNSIKESTQPANSEDVNNTEITNGAVIAPEAQEGQENILLDTSQEEISEEHDVAEENHEVTEENDVNQDNHHVNEEDNHNVNEGDNHDVSEEDKHNVNEGHEVTQEEHALESTEGSTSQEITSDVTEDEASLKANLSISNEMETSSVVCLSDSSNNLTQNSDTTESKNEESTIEAPVEHTEQTVENDLKIGEKPVTGDTDFNSKDDDDIRLEEESFCLQLEEEEASNLSEIRDPQEGGPLEQEQSEQSQTEDDNSQSSIKNSKPANFRSEPEVTSPDKVEFLEKKANQSAKVILADWDDTDSQQSDSKNGSNVNKLIDDWDDDEEEKKEVK